MATFNRVTDVHPGPNRYISEPGSAKNIERYLEDYAHPVIVTGELSAQAFLDYTGADGFFAPALRYDRSATERNARELAEQARARRRCDRGDRRGQARRHRQERGRTAQRGFGHGADARLRVRRIHAVLGELRRRAPLCGLAAARPQQCGDDCRFRAHLARAGDYDNEQVRLLIDTIIGLAGTVGGLGCERARVSGAHALHNGLTQVPGSAATMHGDKVSYGVLVQLVAEGKEAEARQLLAYYDSVGLPHSWKQMNIEFTDENLWTVAEYTTQPDSTFLSAVPNATPQMLVDAMRVVEEFPAEAA